MRRTALAVASIFGITLAGCGGGGDPAPTIVAAPPPATAPTPTQPPPPTPPTPAPAPSPTPAPTATSPDGLYAGKTSTGRSITGLVLDDGSYYVLYSAANNPAIIAGAVQGTGTLSNGSFSSSNGRDINLEGLGVLSATVSASYLSLTSLNGSIAYQSLNQTLSFTSTYDKRYEIIPSLATIAGAYSGMAGSPAGGESGTVTISSSGALVGRGVSGCAFSGTAVPRSKGNAYNLTMTFAGAPCLLPNRTLTGGAYFDVIAKRLFAVGLTADRSTGFIFSGAKL